MLGDGPAAHGGRIDDLAQTAQHFGGGAAVGCGRFGREQLAQERLGAGRPVRRVVATGGGRRPAILVVAGDGAQIIAIELVEASAAQAELIGGDHGRDFGAPKGGEDFADQGNAEAVGELAIMFFIAARMAQPLRFDECRAPAQRA